MKNNNNNYNNTNNNNKLLTRKEAVEFLGLSEGTLAVWKVTKRYPLLVIKVGRLVRYRESDLIKFLDDMTDPQINGEG